MTLPFFRKVDGWWYVQFTVDGASPGEAAERHRQRAGWAQTRSTRSNGFVFHSQTQLLADPPKVRQRLPAACSRLSGVDSPWMFQ